MLDTVVAVLLGQRYFFAGGHQMVVSTIRWAPALVGLGEVHLVLSGFLVATAYLAGPVLAVVWALPWRPAATVSVRRTALLNLVVARTVLAIASMASSAQLRRHLMVWKVFAPRSGTPERWAADRVHAP